MHHAGSLIGLDTPYIPRLGNDDSLITRPVWSLVHVSEVLGTYYASMNLVTTQDTAIDSVVNPLCTFRAANGKHKVTHTLTHPQQTNWNVT